MCTCRKDYNIQNSFRDGVAKWSSTIARLTAAGTPGLESRIHTKRHINEEQSREKHRNILASQRICMESSLLSLNRDADIQEYKAPFFYLADLLFISSHGIFIKRLPANWRTDWWLPKHRKRAVMIDDSPYSDINCHIICKHCRSIL